MASPKEIKRLVGLTNTFSGVVGEMAVATALIRAGLQVAKPYWNDDEVDLLVFWRIGAKLVPIPIQVKSIQNLASKGPTRAIQGLKKRYLEHQPWLCLVIYSPETDKMWLICGSDRIKQVHADWVEAAPGGKGRPRKDYEKIKGDEDVSIYVDLSQKGDPHFDQQWLIDKTSPKTLSEKFREHAERLEKANQMEALLTSFLTSAQPAEETAE